MISTTIKELSRACEGRLVCKAGEENAPVTSVCTDSRKAGPGSLFGAIKGERSDGHDFIGQVEKAGAACVLCERIPENTGIPCIVVPSTLKALQAMAAYILKNAGIPVIAVTGSAGKTSTKEMIAQVLSQKMKVLKTAGNHNNALGLPLTVFDLEPDDRAAVLEHGISRFGEMSVLAGITHPDVCVFTNIGDCHLEDLGDRAGVFRAKGEMFEYMAPDAKLIFNGDDGILSAQKEIKGIKPCFYGFGENCGIRAKDIEILGLSGSAFTLVTPKGSFRVKVPAPGSHMILNALAAAAVGTVFGLTGEEIARGIEGYEPVGGRFNICNTGRVTIIDDCYNANPASMKASLENLSFAEGRKVAILGDMGELGAASEGLHRSVGEFFGRVKIDVLLCAGQMCGAICEAARKADPELRFEMFGSKEELMERLPGILREGDTVLVKASHFCEFGEIVQTIKGIL